MFGLFKKLFGNSGGELPGVEITIRPKGEPSPSDSDPLADAVIRSDFSADFVRLLHEHGIHVVGKNMRKVAGKPFYHFLSVPGEFYVFSSQQKAREFLRTIPIKEPISYSLFGVTANFLLTNDFTKTRLVLNPKSRFERVITNEEIDALRRIQTG